MFLSNLRDVSLCREAVNGRFMFLRRTNVSHFFFQAGSLFTKGRECVSFFLSFFLSFKEQHGRLSFWILKESGGLFPSDKRREGGSVVDKRRTASPLWRRGGNMFSVFGTVERKVFSFLTRMLSLFLNEEGKVSFFDWSKERKLFLCVSREEKGRSLLSFWRQEGEVFLLFQPKRKEKGATLIKMWRLGPSVTTHLSLEEGSLFKKGRTCLSLSWRMDNNRRDGVCIFVNKGKVWCLSWEEKVCFF